ncbi:MAG: L,D-transpeptidase [Anaerolineales bacterium]|nr:L,D-transpeptidase [Anaerolineales bacterium]
MLKRLLSLSLLLLCALSAASAHAAPPWRATHHASRFKQSLNSPALQSINELPPLCPASLQIQRAAECPAFGPSAYLEDAAEAGLVLPLPAIAISPTLPYRGLTLHAYARVITNTAQVFRHPSEAVAGLPPLREFEKGFVFVSALGRVKFAGEEFLQINRSEWVRAEAVEESRPSSFGGQFFGGSPPGAVGWVINTVQVSGTPGAPPAPEAQFVGRYSFITPLNVARVGEWDWYEVIPGGWVEQRNLGLVRPSPPPGAPADVIAVDTYEQTMGVYRGGQLVFATLASSGSRYFPTRPGTFSVWAKFTYGRMTGVYREDRSDYYFLEDVPWILYYDGDRALHGAYWHDSFGIQTSHGCVNLSPRDSRWLFNNTNVGDAVVVFSSR